MQGCVIQVRFLRSMHAQDQQKQALQSQFRKNCRRQLISSCSKSAKVVHVLLIQNMRAALQTFVLNQNILNS